MKLHSKEWEEGFCMGQRNVSQFGNAWAASVILWKTPQTDYERGYLEAIDKAKNLFMKRREKRA